MTVKPYLVCHHTWLQKYSMTDNALDIIGNTYPHINGPLTGQLVKINEKQKYIGAQNS